MLNEKELEKIRLKMNTKEKTETRNTIIEEALENIEAEVNKALKDLETPSGSDLQARMKAVLFDASKLEKQAQAETNDKSEKSPKSLMTHKRIGKTLLLAAVISLLGLSFIITTVASKHNISIENGFVAYMKDAITITFFGDSEEKYISLEVLKADLENNGFENVVVPKYFDNGEWKVTVPKYTDNDVLRQVSFEIYSNANSFVFCITPLNEHNKEAYFLDLKNAETINSPNMHIYLFEHNNGYDNYIDYFNSDYNFSITSKTDYEVMRKIAKTIE